MGEWWEGTSDTERIVSKEERWEDKASAAVRKRERVSGHGVWYKSVRRHGTGTGHSMLPSSIFGCEYD